MRPENDLARLLQNMIGPIMAMRQKATGFAQGAAPYIPQPAGQYSGVPPNNMDVVPPGPVYDPSAPGQDQLSRLGLQPAVNEHPVVTAMRRMRGQGQGRGGFMYRGRFHPYGGRQRMNPMGGPPMPPPGLFPPQLPNLAGTGGVRPPIMGDGITGYQTGGIRPPIMGGNELGGVRPPIMGGTGSRVNGDSQGNRGYIPGQIHYEDTGGLVDDTTSQLGGPRQNVHYEDTGARPQRR